jgi:outer membrane protein OmpU
MKIKRDILTAALVGASAASPAFSQGSVSIYGVLDIGTAYNSNIGGGSRKKVETRHEPSYWGLRGREDLGGGLAAIYQMEQSIAVDTGVANGFSRQALVGLSSTRYGTLTIGRQYDTIVDLVAVDPPRFNSVTGVHVGNYDRTAGVYVNNVIKYRSPTLDGVNGSLMYSPQEDGSSATNSGKSVGASLNYIQGPLRVSMAYLKIEGLTLRPFGDTGIDRLFGVSYANQATKTVLSNNTVLGLGAYYDIAGWRVLGQHTNTRLEALGRTEKMRTTALGFTRDPNDVGLRPGAGFNHTRMAGSTWNTAYGILDYYLSKRTDVYLRVLHQRASGTNQVAALYLEGPSSKSTQTVVGLGVTHRF